MYIEGREPLLINNEMKGKKQSVHTERGGVDDIQRYVQCSQFFVHSVHVKYLTNYE